MSASDAFAELCAALLMQGSGMFSMWCSYHVVKWVIE